MQLSPDFGSTFHCDRKQTKSGTSAYDIYFLAILFSSSISLQETLLSSFPPFSLPFKKKKWGKKAKNETNSILFTPFFLFSGRKE